MTHAVAHIDLSALNHNLERCRQMAQDRLVMAVVKADAYGHGLVNIARALPHADAFGVSICAEGKLLREAGIGQPILVMQGHLNRDELEVAYHHQLQLVIHQFYQLDCIKQADFTSSMNPMTLWLKIDSGMGRFGFHGDQLTQLLEQIRSNDYLRSCNYVLMTHFSDADDQANPKTDDQISYFNRMVQTMGAELNAKTSLANSAGLFGIDAGGDWVRPGIALYGASPFIDQVGSAQGLRPVMTLTAPLISIKNFSKGMTVGYGSDYTCPQDMKVGIVRVGYGDGYPRHAQTGTPVLVNGQRVSLIGRVSMDSIAVDLSGAVDRSGINNVSVGDQVILWGSGLPVEEVAKHASTLSYELLTNLTSRPDRVLKSEERSLDGDSGMSK